MAFLSTWCRTNMQTREKEIFFMNALKISLAPTTRERLLQVMFVRTHTHFENQNATKMTSAIAESRTYSSVGFITSFCLWAATLPMQKLLLCRSVRLTTPLPHVSCPDDGKNNEERAFMCVVNPCRKATIDQAHLLSLSCTIQTKRECSDAIQSRHPPDDVHE